MTQPPNSYYRVTLYVASGQSLELASSSEPQRLNTGEIEATWTDNRHRWLHGRPSKPPPGNKSGLADPKPVTAGTQLHRCNQGWEVER